MIWITSFNKAQFQCQYQFLFQSAVFLSTCFLMMTECVVHQRSDTRCTVLYHVCCMLLIDSQLTTVCLSVWYLGFKYKVKTAVHWSRWRSVSRIGENPCFTFTQFIFHISFKFVLLYPTLLEGLFCEWVTNKCIISFG